MQTPQQRFNGPRRWLLGLYRRASGRQAYETPGQPGGARVAPAGPDDRLLTLPTTRRRGVALILGHQPPPTRQVRVVSADI